MRRTAGLQVAPRGGKGARMNKRLLGGIATLLLGAGSSVGQTPAPPPAALPPLLHAGLAPDALPVLPVSATAGPQTIVPAGPEYLMDKGGSQGR